MVMACFSSLEVLALIRRLTKWTTVLITVLAIPMAFAASTPATVFGWVEEGLIQPEDISVKIKLDTGALTSSLDAKDLERFEQEGEKWVRFTVELKDSDTGKTVSAPFERRVVHPVLIGRKTLEHLGLVDVSKTFTMEPHCGKTSL